MNVGINYQLNISSFHQQLNCLKYTSLINKNIKLNLFIYLFCKNRVSDKLTYFFTALWMLNPLAILDSTVWGQVDSVLTLALVAGLYFIMKDRLIIASVIFGGAVMLKPQAIILVPVLGYALLRSKKPGTVLAGIGAALGTAIIIAMPFALKVDMSKEFMVARVTPMLEMLHLNGGGTATKVATPFAWILSLFIGTADHYSYATVNALNFFFAIDGNWVRDTEPLMGLTWFWWGMINIVIAALITMLIYFKSKKTEALPFVAGSVIFLLVTNFGPRMHERYFFPAVVFLIIAAILSNRRTVLRLSLAESVLGYFTVLEILVDLNLGKPYMWPKLSLIRAALSWANVILAVLVAVYAIADAFGKIEGTKFGKEIFGKEIKGAKP